MGKNTRCGSKLGMIPLKSSQRPPFSRGMSDNQDDAFGWAQVWGLSYEFPLDPEFTQRIDDAALETIDHMEQGE